MNRNAHTYPPLDKTVNERVAGYRPPKPEPEPQTFFVCALDLGKSQDPSARVTARYTLDPLNPDFILRFGEIKLYDLHTRYTLIVEDTIDFLHRVSKIHPIDFLYDNGGVGAAVMEMFTGRLPLPTKQRITLLEKSFEPDDERVLRLKRLIEKDDKKETLKALDEYEQEILSTLSPIGVNIVFAKDAKLNEQATIASPVFNVPKEDLVGAVQFFLQTDRLQIDSSQKYCPEHILEEVFKQLKNFQMKPTKKNNLQWEAKDGEHDDIVIGIALCCWYVFRQLADTPFLWA